MSDICRLMPQLHVVVNSMTLSEQQLLGGVVYSNNNESQHHLPEEMFLFSLSMGSSGPKQHYIVSQVSRSETQYPRSAG